MLTVSALVVTIFGSGTIANIPDHVHKDFQWGSRDELPHDGWMVYSDGDAMFATRLKSFNPGKIPAPGGGDFSLFKPTFSPDGKWLIGAEANRNASVYFIKITGEDPAAWKTFLVPDFKVRYYANFYYNSPNENVDNGLFEIAYVEPDGNKAYAQKVDLSGNEPIMGETRLIGDLGWGKWDEFGASGDLILADDNPTYNVTIPDVGLGTAGPNDVYKYGNQSGGDRMCSGNLSPSSKYWSTNVGGTSLRSKFGDNPEGLAPVNHEGCVVMQARRITDPKVTIDDWVLDPEKGAAAVVFAPDTICVGGDCYFQRKTGGQDNKWFGWAFLNDERYITAHHSPSDGQPNKGGYLIRWQDNTWYEIVPPDLKATPPVAWFDDVPVEPWANKPSVVRVSLKKPDGATRMEVGATLDIEADVKSLEGNITSVTFAIEGGEEIATVSSEPYTATWTPQAAGTYTLTATGADDQGNEGSSLVQLTVLDEIVLTVVDVFPKGAVVQPGAQLQFSAQCKDQDGYLIEPQPTVTWSCGDGGVVDQTGMFTATGDVGTSVTITAKAEGVSGSEQADIRLETIKINFQPSSTNAPDGWLADVGLVYGDRGAGKFFGWNAINTEWARERSEGSNELLNTLTHMQFDTVEFTWELNVPNGEYMVTIGAGDPGYQTGIYKITAEGVAIIDFTPDDETKVNIDSALVTVEDGKLTIDNAEGAQYNRICYITVRPIGGPPEEGFRFLSPSADFTCAVGDTLHIRWMAATSITTAIPSITFNNGVDWKELVDESIDRGTDQWGKFDWVVPPNMTVNGETISLENKSFKMKLAEYAQGQTPQQTILDGEISVVPPSASVENRSIRAMRPMSVHLDSRNALHVYAGARNWTASVVDGRGRTILRMNRSNTVSEKIDMTRLSPGFYIVRIETDLKSYTGRIMVNR